MRQPLIHVEGNVGAPPGLEHDEIASLPGGTERVRVTCVDYAPGNVRVQEVDNLAEFLDRPRPDWSVVRWINIDGLTDNGVIQAVSAKYELHPLAVEDLLHLRQRPKVELYGGGDTAKPSSLFVVVRTLRVEEERLVSEQVSLFLGLNTVLTFQETGSPIWDPISLRIQSKGSRIRANDASFLAYSMLDAIMDNFFPILEQYGERMDALEAIILDHAERENIESIHQVKRDLLLLRWVAWPMREVVQKLQREPYECVSDFTRLYLRDLYDHAVQIIELVEVYRERTSDLTESYMSVVSYHMNEIMKVLTIIGTIFIPLTFLAGVYGMNFRNIPEYGVGWAYPAFWVICAIVAGIMLFIFRRRKWL